MEKAKKQGQSTAQERRVFLFFFVSRSTAHCSLCGWPRSYHRSLPSPFAVITLSPLDRRGRRGAIICYPPLALCFSVGHIQKRKKCPRGGEQTLWAYNSLAASKPTDVLQLLVWFAFAHLSNHTHSLTSYTKYH